MTDGWLRMDAPAKVNLRLRILARETSGYHSLETIFCAVSLSDTLWLRRAPSGIHLQVEGGVETGPPERNLVVRAAERFLRELAARTGLEIRLRKRIPAEAGLGGGSSDAAACLRLLNALFDGAFPRPRLVQMGAELGSDVPFFLCGSPLALGWGRGERLLALPPLPVRPVLLVHPGVPISTADAFRRIAEQRTAASGPEAWNAELSAVQSWNGAASLATNDFEPFARQRIPEIAGAIAAMHETGADIALLSGSGSAAFGVFRTQEDADAAARLIGERGFATFPAATLSEMPGPQVDPP